jgi:hypothetical protein
MLGKVVKKARRTGPHRTNDQGKRIDERHKVVYTV